MPDCLPASVRLFIADYVSRHSHPLNCAAHLVGVPAALCGLIFLLRGAVMAGVALVVLGYYLQYLGHRAQGNEVGEIILLKKLWRLWRARGAKNG